MKETSQMSTFTVAPNIIYSLIKAQAGSLAKAVLECIMNSVDAGATKVQIDYDTNHITIKDNGKGFKSLDEIKECFNVFGFDHTGQDRTYGQFGIGRAQMWNFCSTLWRTNTFSMDVDIKNKGLDYQIKENLEQNDGLTIIGKFYEKQSTTDLNHFQTELTMLAKYAQADVLLNDKIINKKPEKLKWQYETDEAWIDLKEHGELVVYNLGVKVKSFYCSVFGCGGTIVTKPNVRLSLNMARNDILVSECSIWKKLSKDIQKLSNTHIAKDNGKKALSNDQVKNIISQMVNNDYDFTYESIYQMRLIPNIQNRKISLGGLIDIIKRKPFSFGDKGDIILEKAHMSETTTILNNVVFDLFSCDNVDEFIEKVVIIYKNYGRSYSLFNKKDCMANYIDPENVKENYSTFYDIIPKKEYSDFEKVLLMAFSFGSKYLTTTFNYVTKNEIRERTLKIGHSDTALAWTDGHSHIVLTRELLKEAREGFIGISKIAHVIAHEYVHDSANSGSHNHDIDFYNLYHDITMHVNFSNFIRVVQVYFVKKCIEKNIKINSKTSTTFDSMNEEEIEEVEEIM